MSCSCLGVQTTSPSPYRFSWFDWFCLRYPPGWLILFNRHWQHYHADPQGWNWLEYGLFLLPGGFYLAVLLRWLRLGCRAPQGYTEELDLQYQQRFRDEVLLLILKHHFQAELEHTDRLPKTGRLLVLMNHAGMCFPWDFLGLGTLLALERDWAVKPIAHDLFFDHPWLKWWLPPGWFEAMGGIRARKDRFEEAIAHLDKNTILLYAPEGWQGLAKGWHQRYQLAKFHPSFIQLSDRYDVPVLPVLCSGNEYLHPWTLNVKTLANWLNMPIFPLSPLIPLFLLFPSMGVWAMKTRLRYHIQSLEEIGNHDSEHLKTRDAYEEAQEMRSRLQTLIQASVKSQKED